MTDEINDVLRAARTIVLVDWPSRDVPDALARAGLSVVSHDGPEPDHYNAYELDGDDVVLRPVGAPPSQADLVYSYRPTDELPGIVEWAVTLGAKAIWCEPGSAEDRSIVEGAGLAYAGGPIVEAAGRLA